MASKNSASELAAEGFNESQFVLEGGTTFNDLLNAILNEATLVIKRRVGAVNYTSTDADIANSVKRAERFQAAAEIWLRIMNSADADTALGSEGNNNQSFARYEKFRRQYLDAVEVEIASIPDSTSLQSSTSSAPGFGYVASSPFDKAAQ